LWRVDPPCQETMTTPITLAYLGPAGTFTEEAARQYRPDATLVPCPTIPAIARAVLDGSAEQGVFPIENSLQGAVTDTLDLLIHGDGLRITQEIAIPISHCLVMKPGTDLGAITRVYSHPQALGQCREYLERKFPNAKVAASLSTAAAVQQALDSPTPAAAISNRRAAELTGAEVVEEGVQDNPNNVTRFVVLAKADHAPTGRDKTSICFSFAADKPGQLYWAMGEFAQRNVNLSKVESRPTRMGLGQYYFLVDLEGHREDPVVKEALENLGKATSLLKVLGSYPRYTLPL
jgi:prephenate dehydratase